MKFSYKALENGKMTSSIIEADTQREAVEILANQGISVITLVEKKSFDSKAIFGAKKKKAITGSKRITLSVLTKFFKKLYKMTACGMVISDAIGSIDKRTTDAAEKTLTRGIMDDLMAGESLSSALRKFGGNIDESIYSLILAGENSGKIADAIGDALKIIESRGAIRKKIIKSMIYPVFLIVAVFGVLIGVSKTVMPEIIGFIRGSGGKVPAISSVFEFIARNWLWIIGSIAATIFIIICSIKITRQTENGKYVTDGIILRLPVCSPLAVLTFRAGVAKLLGTLFGNGVQTVDALNLAEVSIKNRIFLERFQRAKKDIMDGKPVYQTFEKHGVFDGEACDVVQVGEKVGDLAFAFRDADKMYSESLNEGIGLAMKSAITLAMMVAFATFGFLALGLVSIMMAAASGTSAL